jgi:hypothetical protein
VSSTNLANPPCGESNPPTIPNSTNFFQQPTSTNVHYLLESAESLESSSFSSSSLVPAMFSTNQSILKFSNLKLSGQFDIIECSHSSKSNHNLSVSNFLTMEDDCEETTAKSDSTPDSADISRLLQYLTVQSTLQNNKLLNDFHHVMHTKDVFKQEFCPEMDEIRAMISDLKKESIATSTQSSGVKTSYTLHNASIPVPGLVPPSSPVQDANITSSSDPRTQMMLLFANSFSKFSTVLTDNQETLAKLSSALTNKSDSKAEWPKFSGDQKKFRAWYLAIMAQILLPPWVVYDSTTNDIVSATTNSTLNGKLYSKLLLALEGTALKSVVSHKHLCANGILLLHELEQTYRQKKCARSYCLQNK